MILKYYGHSFFTLTLENGSVIAFDPYGTLYEYPRRLLRADVCLISHHHYDHDGLSCLEAGAEVIDTPGEYAETASLGRALALYAYEADVVGLLCGATEPYCLFPPCVAAACTRPVIGIVTRIDEPGANPGRAQRWLELAGCRPVFRVSAYSGEGIWRILSYLKEPGDRLPWENAEEAERPRTVLSDKYGETGRKRP